MCSLYSTRDVYSTSWSIFSPQPGPTRVDFSPHFLFSFSALRAHSDTFYGHKLVHSALKALTKPLNRKSMPKRVQNRQNSRFFHIFRAYFLPQIGPRPIFLSPPPATLPLYYIHPCLRYRLCTPKI